MLIFSEFQGPKDPLYIILLLDIIASTVFGVGVYYWFKWRMR